MSESEEMYLVSLALLLESGASPPVPVSQLAEELAIQPVSANQMVRKLANNGWVEYTPYKGIALTPDGKRIAARTLRHRRLWEVFLVESLHFLPLEASELACRMEHVLPDEAVERLASFLGNPATNPQGQHIPPAELDFEIYADLPLPQLKAGEQGCIARLQVDTATRSFLASVGIRPGAEIRMLGVEDRGAVLVSVGERSLHLAAEVASQIFILSPGCPKTISN